MNTKLLAALAALVLTAPFASRGLAGAATVEASFDGARFADDLYGTFSGDPTAEIRVRTYGSAGSTISATLSPDPVGSTPIAGVSLALVDDSGTDQNVAGGTHDKSVAGSGTIVWNKVPLPATGGYSFVLRGTGAGGWRLKLKGTLAKTAETFPSPANLAVNGQTTVDFHGLRGGMLTFSLAPTGKSFFRGSLLRVERPDDTTIDASVPAAGVNGPAKGKVLLDTDGVHHLVFKNVGQGIGAWLAKTSVAPGKVYARRGYVRSAGTALVPAVVKVTPSSDFHKDDALSATLTGRDFQPGADVRLVRKGFPDIVATDVAVDSETQIRCTLDLNTALVTGVFSLGTWNVAVTNAPVYSTPGDPTTIDKTSPTRDQKKTFACVAAGSITLPAGVIKNTETWQLTFDSDFQTDLNRMGLGSADGAVAALARKQVENYVVCFLRALMQTNETTGGRYTTKFPLPVLSFTIGTIPGSAGKAGEDYDRIEIGGAWQTGDEADPAEPLLWGSAPLDPGNAHRDDLSATIDVGGVATRVGRGARTRILDPGAPTASADWVAAMAPLRLNPLTSADAGYFSASYFPVSAPDALRYVDVVNQTTRAAREIAALVAHQIGRAMGLSPGGVGPMQSPQTAGYLWPTTTGLAFAPADLTTLQTDAAPATLPGKTSLLVIPYFPFLSTQPSYLPDATATVDYATTWNFVGGRPTAVPADYSVSSGAALYYPSVPGTIPLLGNIAIDFTGLTMTATPLTFPGSPNLPYGGISILAVGVADTLRGTVFSFQFRLNIQPNVAQLQSPPSVRIAALNLVSFIANN